MKNLLLLSLLAVGALSAQQGLLVTEDDGAPREFYTKYFFLSTNTLYLCLTKSSGETTTQTVSAITNASPASLTITGHGFHSSSRPTVTFEGGCCGSWALTFCASCTSPAHATYIATVVDANTITVPVDTSTFGSVVGTIVLTTNAPRVTRPIWFVQKLDADVSSNPQAALWALGGSSNICANRASLSYK